MPAVGAPLVTGHATANEGTCPPELPNGPRPTA